MGIHQQALQLLLLAQAEGVRFDRTATLGRLFLYIDTHSMLEEFASFDLRLDLTEAERIMRTEDGYADPLFRHLGAVTVESVDASPYEGCTIVLDMNHPVPSALERRFSTVIDFGTLEHIFNVPVALRNSMEMVEPDGHLLCYSPGNNFFGHGFYQFSPEFYFRTLTPENGFAVEHALVCTDEQAPRWFVLSDPSEIGRRVTLQNSIPSSLAVIARRINTSRAFASMPQESDYAAVWSRASGLKGVLWRRGSRIARKGLPERSREKLKGLIVGGDAHHGGPDLAEISIQSVARQARDSARQDA